jgi:hypothetical protein
MSAGLLIRVIVYMARTTTQHRTVEHTIPGTTGLWNSAGTNHFAIASFLGSGTSILHVWVQFSMQTVDFVTGSTLDVPLGVDPSLGHTIVGVWTDMYNIGVLPPDPEFSGADPGWLMMGQMDWTGPYPTLTNGHTTQLYYHWRLSKDVKWDVERSAGPVPIGSTATVYWVWNNISLDGAFNYTQTLTGHSINTSGSLWAQVLTKP